MLGIFFVVISSSYHLFVSLGQKAHVRTVLLPLEWLFRAQVNSSPCVFCYSPFDQLTFPDKSFVFVFGPEKAPITTVLHPKGEGGLQDRRYLYVFFFRIIGDAGNWSQTQLMGLVERSGGRCMQRSFSFLV